MTDFDYPPSREFTLTSALAGVEDDLSDAEQRIERLEDDEDAQDSALAEARQSRQAAESQRGGLEWAIREFGEDARVCLEAFTATTRARTLDEVRASTVGSVGSEETRIWLLAAALSEAPWLDGDEDLPKAYRITGELPPPVQDYLDDVLEDVNDLAEGNS